MIVDCHSHILPGIDDGSKSTNETSSLLKALSKSGIDHVVLTPHYYIYEQSVADFIEKRTKAYNKLISLDEAKGMKFTLGCELYLIDLVLNLESFEGLTVGDSSYVLAEIPPEKHFTDAIQKNIDGLIREGLTPILAHIDRYPCLWDVDLIDELRDMGCLMQMNIMSLTERRKRRKLNRLLDYDLVDFFGTDLHRAPFDSVRYEESLRILKKIYSDEDIHYMNSKAIDNLFSETAS